MLRASTPADRSEGWTRETAARARTQVATSYARGMSEGARAFAKSLELEGRTLQEAHAAEAHTEAAGGLHTEAADWLHTEAAGGLFDGADGVGTTEGSDGIDGVGAVDVVLERCAATKSARTRQSVARTL